MHIVQSLTCWTSVLNKNPLDENDQTCSGHILKNTCLLLHGKQTLVISCLFHPSVIHAAAPTIRPSLGKSGCVTKQTDTKFDCVALFFFKKGKHCVIFTFRGDEIRNTH